MTDQVEQTPTTLSSNDQNQSSENTEKPKENESIPSEQTTTRRSMMPQDIRYATDENDRNKLIKKYENYQISDVNACNIRFLTDNRQRKSIFGRNEEENSNINSLAKTFHVNLYPGYQQSTKHSYKIFGTESNVRKCLIELMNRMFKRSNRSQKTDQIENTDKYETPDPEKSQETESPLNKESNEESSPSVSVVVSTNNTGSTVVEEQTVVESNTAQSQETEASSNDKVPQESTSTNSDKTVTEQKRDDGDEHAQLDFKPVERKPQYTFVMLISSQGQEVLKKNWSFFAGSLQQRLNVIVTNPVKLPKFGDKQVQNELSITGELINNLTDACLQITSFINDVLGIPVQLYKGDEESANNDNDRYQHSKTDNRSHRSSLPNYQGRPSYNNYHGRTFFNRHRNDIFEQVILIRSDCVSRIVGTRAANLKRIQTKCHLREMIVGRQANENGYVECSLVAFQSRNINFAIDTIRSFLRNEDHTAVLVPEFKHDDIPSKDSPHLHELAPPNPENSSKSSADLRLSNKETGFMTTPLNLGNNNIYSQPSYNFQNPPSFDFTHQATTASRKTDKRRGDLHDHNKTPSESQTQQYDGFSSSNYSSNSPRHKSKRSCPETKEIDCTTDEGFWIQKQYYYALDDTSKQLFDSLMEKLEKIRIANEENAARKQQRLVGRNRSNKTRVHTSSISYLNDESNINEKDSIVKPIPIDNPIKVDPLADANEEKENNQETSTVVVNQD